MCSPVALDSLWCGIVYFPACLSGAASSCGSTQTGLLWFCQHKYTFNFWEKKMRLALSLLLHDRQELSSFSSKMLSCTHASLRLAKYGHRKCSHTLTALELLLRDVGKKTAPLKAPDPPVSWATLCRPCSLSPRCNQVIADVKEKN